MMVTGNSPLHVAAVLGRVECLQLLISLRLREGSSHSHLDDTNRRGQSALHAAIEAEQIASIQRLLSMTAFLPFTKFNIDFGSKKGRVVFFFVTI